LSPDLRLAARIAGNLASLRLRVAEIAEQALAHPAWDTAAVARDLHGALKDAEDSGSSDLPEASRS
jgi:hypothetical protein